MLGDPPITPAPTVNIIDASIRTGLRPSISHRKPPEAAASAAAPIVDATISSCHIGVRLNLSSIFNMAPDTTPVS